MASQIDTANMERIGISAISLFCERHGWTFRETPHSDYGIDAEIEQKINGERTNRHISLQIKSGKSYTKVKKNGKITFSLDPWHYKYWLNSDRPVLILLYDPESEKIYWEQVRLSVMQKAPQYTKIEIESNQVLDKDSFDKFNEIIETYVKHETFHVEDGFVNFDSSFACMQEYRRAFNDLTEKFEEFRQKIQCHYPSPNTEKFCLQLDIFGIDVRKHIESDYQLMHKACWYLAYLAYKLPDKPNTQLQELLNAYIANLIAQKVVWLNTKNNFKKLFHPDVPKKVQRSASKVIRYLENYSSLIDLSLDDFLACQLINKQYSNGKAENAKP